MARQARRLRYKRFHHAHLHMPTNPLPADEAPAAPAALRVLLVDDGSVDLSALRNELARLGCEVVGVVDAAVELAREVEARSPDAIIINSESPQRDTLEHIAAMSQAAPRPIVMFTDDPDTGVMQRAIRAGVSSYVVSGLQPERLMPILQVAIARFEAEASLRAELAATREQLADRKQVEKAKGILMFERGLNEDDAFAQLRKMAMDRKLKLGDMAMRIIAARDLLG
jgi:response regulator NasT